MKLLILSGMVFVFPVLIFPGLVFPGLGFAQTADSAVTLNDRAQAVTDSSFNSSSQPASSLGAQAVIIHIQPGMSLNQTARLLQEKDLIKSVLYFKFLAWARGAGSKIRAGEYVFQKSMSPWRILSLLVQGKTRLHPVTFPEGYNMYEMAHTLEKRGFGKAQAFIRLCLSQDFIYAVLGEEQDSLEGYLFPETYHIARPVDLKKLIRKMTGTFFKVYDRISQGGIQIPGKAPGAHGQVLTRREAVILASIIEKETGLARERTVIASVFYNRLKLNMRLESDPTILYGMMREAGGLVPLNIRKQDILRKTPYNTYRVRGFPQGPVGNPGEGALKAVFYPQTSDFLYFVSRNDGSHLFSKTYREHKKAVDIYQRKLAR